MRSEQAQTLAQFINDHDPRFRAKTEEDGDAGKTTVRCYARVENGGSGEDAALYENVESYVEEARRAEGADSGASFATQLNAWLADQEKAERPD